MKKRNLLLTVSILFTNFSAFTQSLHLDYYGVVTSSEDSSMLKMAQDMFFTQLNSIDNLTVDDKRPDSSVTLNHTPDISSTTGTKVAFWAVINETKNEDAITWNCNFVIKNPADNSTINRQENFDSYYKILVNAKSSIEEILTPLKYRQITENTEKEIKTESSQNLNLELLAGNWTGEAFADKIVILRGGRGFIIYKNGATMNIQIKVINNQIIKIIQTGKPNASFYPKLDRQIALKEAVNAEPIEWTFTAENANILTGNKSTLIQDGQKAVKGQEKVTWFKKQ